MLADVSTDSAVATAPYNRPGVVLDANRQKEKVGRRGIFQQ